MLFGEYLHIYLMFGSSGLNLTCEALLLGDVGQGP
jgi:hypothetical protein